MSLKRSKVFLAGIVCFLLASCDNVFYSIASSGDKEPNVEVIEEHKGIGEYTVRFDKNGGDTDADPQTMLAKAPSFTVMLPNVEPDRDGYIFTGWNTSVGGSGTKFTRGTPVKANMTVYAQWLELEPDSHIVHFDKNNADDNSHEASPQKKAVISPDTTIDELPEKPTRIGYDFIEWNTSDGGNGTAFDENTTVSAEITVYAQWDPYKCVVSYNKNNTDVDSTEANPAEKTVTYPAINVGTLPAEPKREGYDFKGWNTRADGKGTAFTAVTPVGILQNKAVTVYAQWAEKTYTISGTVTKSDGGNAVGATVELFLNGNRIARVTTDTQGKYTIPGVLARNNYTIRASLTGYSDDTTDPFDMPKDDLTGKDLTLQKLCGVTFDSNGGSSVPTQYMKSGETAKRPTNPSKTGYLFDNWYDVLNFVYDFDSTLVTDDITLYAKWNPITYTVVYNTNGGNGGGPMTNQPFTYDVDQNLRINTFTRTGHNFGGWARSTGGAVEFDDGDSALNLTTTDGATINLYARWNPITYTVVYNANGGSGTTANSTHIYGISQALTTNAFIRAGYAFVGWKDNENDISYTNGQNVLNLRDMQGATVTLFAQWMPAYNVTFDKNNGDAGSTEANPQTIPVISPATNVGTLPAPPIRTGYIFSGWNTQANGSGTVFIASTPVTADIPVYAQWKAREYTITYRDVGDGTFSGTHGPNPPTSHTYGVETELVDPTKANYSFGGWFTDSAGTEGPLTILSATGYTGTITLYAKWTGNTYTITYRDFGGGPFSGTTGPGPTSHTYGTATTLFSPTKTGYAFDGWFEDGLGTALTTIPATRAANITLHAKWVANIYTIIYRDVDGGSFSGTHGTNPPTSHTYGTTTTLVNPAKINYTFGGWFRDIDGWGAPVTALSATGDTDTITLYAKWTGDSYTINYWDDPGIPFSGTHRSGAPTTHTYGTATPLVDPVEPAGKTFVGWFYNNGGSTLTSLSATGYTSEINLYARWVDVTYTIIYYINGGTGTPPSTQPVNYGGSFTTHSGSGLSKLGYTFSGWNTDENGTGTDFAADTLYYPTSNLYLYAKWVPISYYVAYDKNDTNATGVMTNSTHTYGVSQNLRTNTFTNSGYDFAGWARTTLGAAVYTDGQSVSDLSTTQNETITLFAVWTAAQQYIVSFNINNGIGITPPSETKYYGETIILPNNGGFSRGGYTFVGWNTDPDGDGTNYTAGSSYTVTGTRTLYAKWEAIPTYTVTFNANAGGDTVDNLPNPITNVAYNATISQPPTDPSRAGYTFDGWYRDTEGDTAWNFVIDTVTTNTPLYAKWIPISYTVSFNANGGAGTTMANQTFTYGVYQNLSPNTYTRTGYTFAGWATSTGGSLAYTDGQNVRNLTTSATTTLYAKWNEITVITVNGGIKLNGGSGNVSDIVVQLYRYNEDTKVLEPVGKAENPTEDDQFNGEYTVTGEVTAGYIYFITASLAGYETKVVSVSIPGGTVSIELDFIGTRRSVPRSIEQMIMELTQGGFRN